MTTSVLPIKSATVLVQDRKCQKGIALVKLEPIDVRGFSSLASNRFIFETDGTSLIRDDESIDLETGDGEDLSQLGGPSLHEMPLPEQRQPPKIWDLELSYTQVFLQRKQAQRNLLPTTNPDLELRFSFDQDYLKSKSFRPPSNSRSPICRNSSSSPRSLTSIPCVSFASP